MPGIAALMREIERRPGAPERGPATPLYAFDVGDEDLERLGHGLAAELQREGCDGMRAAAFCLYAAHGFCRWHRAGQWKWSTVLERIGLDWCPGVRLYGLVERGLAYWQRPLVRLWGDTLYLTTLACEGGLPLSLLTSDGGSLRAYFRRLLAAAELAPQTAVRELASEPAVVNGLPKSLSSREVFEIASTLVGEVARLRRLLAGAASSATDPLVRLDRIEPSWRQGLPLRIDDEATRELLQGLIAQPGLASRSSISLETALTLGAMTVRRRPRVAPSIGQDELAASLGVPVDKLSVRLSLALQTATGAWIPLAIATSLGDHFELLSENRLIDVPLYHGVRLAAQLSGSRVAGAISGGEGLPVDAPWVFGGDHGQPVLLAAGSMQSRLAELWVSPPEDSNLEVVSGALDEIGRLAGVGRRVVRIDGKVRIVGDDGEVWLIQAGAAHDEIERLEIRGTPVALGGGGSFYYPDLPGLWSTARGCPVDRRELEWRPVGGRTWRPVLERAPFGDAVVRERGGTLARVRILVLPAACRPRFSPGDDARRGSIELPGLRPDQVDVRTPGVRVQRAATPTGVRLELVVDRTPPRLVELALTRDEGRAIVAVPYPAEARSFLDLQGHELAHDAHVSLGDLRCARAVVQTPISRRRFSLRVGSPNIRETVLARAEPDQDGRIEWPLDTWWRELSVILAASDELDSKVRLRICEDTETSPGIGIHLRRYDAHLERPEREEGYTLVWSGTSDDEAPAGVVVRYAAFADDLSGWKELEPEAPGRWPWVSAEHPPGRYLVVADAPGGLAVRPIRLTVADPAGRVEPAPASLRLSDVVVLPDGTRRREALDQILLRLADDPDDPEWPALMRQLDAVLFLPATALDLGRALVRHPRLLVLAMLRCPDPKLAARLWVEAETMPFIWSAVSLQIWLAALKQLMAARSRLIERLPEEDRSLVDVPPVHARRCVSRLIAAVAVHEPAMHVLEAVLDRRPAPVSAARYKAALDRIRRRPCDIRTAVWPRWGCEDAAARLKIRLRFGHDVPGSQRDVLNTPSLLAAMSDRPALGSGEGPGFDVGEIVAIRRCIEFDREWFEVALAHELGRLVGLKES